MKNITIYIFGILLLISISSGLFWESYFARQLLPKSMENVALFRLLMDQTSKMSATQLIAMQNYTAEIHEIQTEDGYFLAAHRIPFGRNNSQLSHRPAVLLFHSLFTSSDSWILRGTKDLAFLLADNGYDVWLTNSRGNFYSRKHVTLNPDTDKEFWDFSFHEMGKYDLPATIDYILNKTNEKSLFYIGHSMGCTAFLILASIRPEYNKKVYLMQAFAPPAFFVGKQSTILKIVRDAAPTITKLFETDNYYEIYPLRRRNEKTRKQICSIPSIRLLCTAGMYAIVGFDNEQQNNTLLPVSAYFPSGSSIKVLRHFSQLIKSGDFRQFDYGTVVNQQKYKSMIPSRYDLSKVTAPVQIYYGDGDYLVSGEDTLALQRHLPNCVGTIRVPFHNFNHLDFLWSYDSKSLLYDQVIATMNKYKRT